MEGGKFLQQLSRQQHFLIQQQQHGLSWLTSLWSKGIIQVVNNIHCTWETPIFLFNYFNKVYDMTIIRQSIRSFNIPPGNSRKFDCRSCQRLGIWTLSGGGWGIWTENVKSFQPNKRVSVKEFKIGQQHWEERPKNLEEVRIFPSTLSFTLSYFWASQ